MMVFGLKSNFLFFFDFLNIAIEAYNKSQAFIYKKILSTLANQMHTSYIELEKLSLELDDHTKYIYDYDIKVASDTMLEAIEDIKLLKSKIQKTNSKEFEFSNLYNQADDIHNLMLEILEKLAYLEIEELKKENAA